MEINCEIIRDLLPLYFDDVCSQSTRTVVNDHICECEICKRTYETLSKNTDISSADTSSLKNETNFFNNVKKKIRIKKIIVSVVTAAITAGVVFGVYSLCTLPRWPIAYSEENFTIADMGDMIAISYNGDSYAQIKAIPGVKIVIDGEEKKVALISYQENISSKYFETDKYRRKIEDGGDMAFPKKDLDYIYYVEEGWSDEDIVKLENLGEKSITQGNLIWKAE